MVMVPYADYLMIITPPEAIVNEIGRYKRASVNVIGHFEGMYSAPHIVITHQTRCKPFLVQPAIERMAERLSTMPPISLHINGFASFSRDRDVRTIYAAVEQTEPAMHWFKLLHKQLGIKQKDFMPHIPIAANIPLSAFNKLWRNFENRPWQDAFKVNTLTIMHRETFVDYCEWRVYRELFFANRLKEIF